MPPKKAPGPSKKTEQKKKEKVIEVNQILHVCPIAMSNITSMHSPRQTIAVRYNVNIFTKFIHFDRIKPLD